MTAVFETEVIAKSESTSPPADFQDHCRRTTRECNLGILCTGKPPRNDIKKGHKGSFRWLTNPRMKLRIERQNQAVEEVDGEIYSEKGESILVRVNGHFRKIDRDKVSIQDTEHYNAAVLVKKRYGEVWRKSYVTVNFNMEQLTAEIKFAKFIKGRWSVFKEMVYKYNEWFFPVMVQNKMIFVNGELIRFKSAIDHNLISKRLRGLDFRLRKLLGSDKLFPWGEQKYENGSDV